VIEMLSSDYSVALLCEVLDCAKSSYDHPGASADDIPFKAAIEAVLSEWPTHGYRRVTAQLRRLMREMGWQARAQRRPHRTTNSAHAFPRYPNLVQDLEVLRPEQVWVCDITYVHLQHEFVYLALMMDVFTRCIRGWHLGRQLDHTLTALQRALAQHSPEIHHSDQGVQYAAAAYTQTLQAAHIQISMAEVGAAWQNGYAERLIRTIKEEEVYLNEYQNFADAYRRIGHFIRDVYQTKRIHSALGYLTPAEFEALHAVESITA
jgi:transposase InsO family protein